MRRKLRAVTIFDSAGLQWFGSNVNFTTFTSINALLSPCKLILLNVW